MTTEARAAIVAVALRLRIDAWTAEVVAAMRALGIRAILLKGPAVARWLYPDDPEQRPYTDVDLIVSPADTKPARAVLERLGFVALPHPPMDAEVLHALPYRREGDGANIDLHRTLHGLHEVPSEHVWQLISAATATMRVGGLDIEVPSIPVRILHVVLHLGHSYHPGTQPWRDLERCLSHSTSEDWQVAIRIARELGVENEIGIRLRRLPEGAQLADEFDLTRRGSRYYRLREAIETGEAPGSVHSIWALKALPDSRSRLAYLRVKLLPSEGDLRVRYSLARRGHTALARTLHVALILGRLPATLSGWVRHYRE